VDQVRILTVTGLLVTTRSTKCSTTRRPRSSSPSSGDSIRCVAQHLHTPYETVRQAVNRLEDAGYVTYDEGLSVVDEHVRDAARELVAASAGVSPPSIEEAYVIPQFGEWPFAFTRVDAVYVWTQGGYQVSRDPDDTRYSSLFASRTSTPGRRSSHPSGYQPPSSASPATRSMVACRSFSSHAPHSTSSTLKATR